MTSNEPVTAKAEPARADAAPGVTSGAQSSAAQASGGPRRATGNSLPSRRSELTTDQGKTSIADSVVLKIAGIAAREVDGVHAMGTTRARAFGAIRDKIPVAGPGLGQGVSVEVGERQAAVDLDLVVEYGVAIVDVSQAVRDNVIASIERMTGLEVTEVNISVDDIWLGDEDEASQPARVR